LRSRHRFELDPQDEDRVGHPQAVLVGKDRINIDRGDLLAGIVHNLGETPQEVGDLADIARQFAPYTGKDRPDTQSRDCALDGLARNGRDENLEIVEYFDVFTAGTNRNDWPEYRVLLGPNQQFKPTGRHRRD